MGKKVRKALSFKENCSPQASQKTIALDFSNDTDIIESSFVDENKYNEKIGKFAFNHQNDIKSPNGLLCTKELNESWDSMKSKNNALRLNLRRNYRLVDDALPGEKMELTVETPCKNKILREPTSIVKKFISTIKKTPEESYLSKSKLRNIEQWLNGNAVETVCTPPFANLSITPVNSPKQRYSSQWKKENQNLEESSLDSEVEGVLEAIYGCDWKRENVQIHTRTEPKKKRKKFFLPSIIKKIKEPEDYNSVKINILNKEKLNLDDKSDEENNFDDSFLSGVKIISLDSSSCSNDQMKINMKVTSSKKKKYNAVSNSYESFYFSPDNKKSRIKPVVETENQKQRLKISSSKKLLSQVETKAPKKTFLASLSVSTPTSKCHPEARYYKINFKSKKEELVKKLFKLYNTEVFDGKLAEDMNFSWNIKLRETAGYCYNKRITKSTGEIVRLSRIEFSSKIVDRADRLRDTMIHELCHAASWVINGVLDGHGDVWSKWASRAMDRFSELPSIKRCHNYEIISKYVYKCTGCGYSIKRHSKSINIERKRCGHCYGVFELLINKKKKGKGEIPEFDTTKTLPTPNKFAMFVKENYHSVKSAKMNAKHSEIMKILSQKYALIKNGSKSIRKAQDV